MRQLRKRRTTTLMSVALTATLVCGVTNGYAAAAPEEPGVGFSSSFEDGQPQPSWVSTVETDAAGNAKSAGMIGSSGTGTPGNVADQATVAASGDNSGSGEGVTEINDLNINTKWLVFASTGWV